MAVPVHNKILLISFSSSSFFSASYKSSNNCQVELTALKGGRKALNRLETRIRWFCFIFWGFWLSYPFVISPIFANKIKLPNQEIQFMTNLVKVSILMSSLQVFVFHSFWFRELEIDAENRRNSDAQAVFLLPLLSSEVKICLCWTCWLVALQV